MKTLEYLILTVILTFIVTNAAAAQTNSVAGQTNSASLYVVLQHSEGSAAYDANFERLANEVVSKYSNNSNVVFVMYNVSNDEIMANTGSDIDWYTIYNTAYDNQGQEGIVLMDPATKQVIEKINLDASTKDILKSISKGSRMIARSNTAD